MAKHKTQKSSVIASAPAKTPANSNEGLFASNAAKVDPALASLFSASSGPVQARKSRTSSVKASEESEADEDDEREHEDESEDRESGDSENLSQASAEEEAQTSEDIEGSEHESVVPVPEVPKQPAPDRKRKRKQNDDDLEGNYLHKLAQEEEEEEMQLRKEREGKRQKFEQDGSQSNGNANGQPQTADVAALSPPPEHESLAPRSSKTEDELDKAARTVFLANVSITGITSSTAKKELLTHLSSHLSTLTASTPPHKIESFRFRSTAYSSALPKKASFTRGELKEATSHSTNAYCVYSTKVAAREAARRLNGSMVLGRHLRVDEVAHPMKVDHRRCVFVGNLGFVDDETEMKASLANSEHPEDKKKAQSKALKGDVEEGLWVQFAKAGAVESVRVVRDAQTRIGKGFAYVQFKDENAVEKALLFNDKKFPPLLPRKLRVTRCKKPSQTAMAMEKNKARTREAEQAERIDKRGKKRSSGDDNPNMIKIKPDEQALQGRLKKMLGRAGVAEMRAAAKGQKAKARPAVNSVLKPEKVVFEGHRATSDQGNSGLKLGGMKRKKDRGQVKKRSERDMKRASTYKNKQKAK